jgi:SAM-dependent methyltransferase
MADKEGSDGASLRFTGFDVVGEVFLDKGRVLRGIYTGNGDTYRDILQICEHHNLFRSGIVPTYELALNPYPERHYDLVLEHERVPFISYPYEWTAGMLKDAALFHIELFQELNQYGLTIKDFHPYNILFRNTEPVFIDFTSIIHSDSLKNEEYLQPSRMGLIFGLFRSLGGIDSLLYYQMYKIMCLPYFVLPLYLMQQFRHNYARKRMMETTLNSKNARVIIPAEMLCYAIPRPWRWKHDIILYLARTASKYLALLQREKSKKRFWEILKNEVAALQPSLSGSDYSAYYDSKAEEFGFEPSLDWTPKNRVIYESIRHLRPETLLDIGCNTGWFSILASKLGCRVVAIDNDEACAGILYTRAKREHLDILPLVLDVTNTDRDRGDIVSIAVEERLKCDVVLALAIIHHMVLGRGQSFAEVVQLLNSFARNHLILEFVPLNDDRIIAEPEFFTAFHANPDTFAWYTQDNLLKELGRYYTTIKIEDSFPRPRTLLICSK